MKLTKIDKLGRIVIPIGYRRALNLSEDTNVKVILTKDSIVIEREKVKCNLCGKLIEEEYEFPLCGDCINKIKSMP